MQLWIWRNLRIHLPADWEMLQFSRDVSAGRCAFADRYQFRLEVNWRVVDGPPDFERMISDYQAKLQEDGMKGMGRLRQGAWHGVGGSMDGHETTRFGRYFPRESCLVELVFLWPDLKDGGMEQEIVDSVAEEPEYNNCVRRWRAFGMDLLVSSKLILGDCTVQPAHAEMVFADSKHRVEERFGRRGMVSEWLKGSVGEWLEGWISKDVEVTSRKTCEIRGHRVECVVGEKRTPGLSRLLVKRLRCDAAAWICQEDGRLYAISRACPTNWMEADVTLAGSRLACCARMELEL